MALGMGIGGGDTELMNCVDFSMVVGTTCICTQAIVIIGYHEER